MKYFIHLWLVTMLVIVLAVSCTLSNQEPADASAAGLAPSGTVDPAGAPGVAYDGPYEVWVADYPCRGDGQMGSGTADKALERLAEERHLAGEPDILSQTDDEVGWQLALDGEVVGRATARSLADGSWGVVGGWSCAGVVE